MLHRPKARVFAKATPFLLFCAFSLALGETVYGYDVSSFGGVQAIPGFKKHFGTLGPDGKYSVSTTQTALLNSLASVGTVIGRLGAGPLVERFGHRYTLLLMVFTNYIGTIIEITSNSVAQFIVGRIVLYCAVGLVSVSVPTYQSELVPAGMRAFTVASLQFFLVCGGLIASGVNKAYSTGEGNASWRIPVGFTFLFPTIVLCTLPFLPDAPRWLLFKNRQEDAVKTLKRVRPKSDVDSGMCELEIEAIEESLAVARVKLPWSALFQGTNRRRFGIAICAFVFQQLGGQAFTSQYSTLFYQSVGLGDNAFNYPLITTGLSLIAVAAGMYCLDRFGRRPVYIYGGLSQAFWIFMVAGLGGRANPSKAEINGVVASVILYSLSFSIGWAPAPYATASEIASNELREKTMALSAAIGSFSSWLVSFTLPYLMNPSGAGLGPKVGYIYGAMCVLSVVVAYFFFPETKGRALEELDELFEKKVPAWKFATTQTTGAGRRVTAIERDEVITEAKIEMSTKGDTVQEERVEV